MNAAPRRTAAVACLATLTLTGCVTTASTDPHGPGASRSSATSATNGPDAAPTSTGESPSSALPPLEGTTDDTVSAAAIINEAQDELQKATSFTMRSVVVKDGVTQTYTTRGAVSGSALEQRLESVEDGTSTYRLIGSKLYLKGDATFWGEDSYAQENFVDRWVIAPDDSAKKDIVKEMSLKAVVDEVCADGGPIEMFLGSGTIVTRTTSDGVPVYVVHHEEDRARVWVTQAAPHRLTRIEGIVYDDGATATEYFSGYGTSTKRLAAPAGAPRLPDDYASEPRGTPSV